MTDTFHARDHFAVSGPSEAHLDSSDGIRLVADIYRPDAPGRFPVLLMRQPYGRKIASTVVLAHPAWYAAHGYIVVVQDVRGRGGSGGAFRVLEHEAADGAATLAWAADLPGSDGRVATYGFSYHAVTQLLALAGSGRTGTKRPDAIVPIMGAFDIRNDWVFDGGAFRMGLAQYWAAQVGAETARLAGLADAYHAFARAAVGGSYHGPRPGRPDVFSEYGHLTHYDRWLADDPAYWAKVSPSAVLADDPLDVPALFVGGWFDFMLRGTLGAHAAFARGGAARRLIVGPWPHIPWGRFSTGRDFGPDALPNIDRETIRFLDGVLKDRAPSGPPLRLFDLGTSAWRDFDAWPDTRPMILHLASTGLAATTTTDGKLVAQPEAGVGWDMLVHDPWRPAPWVGGALGNPNGLADRSAHDERTDVAVYTSAPLAEAITLAGKPSLSLFIEADCPSHDIFVALSLVGPDGRARCLTQGVLRVTDPASPDPRQIDLEPTLATVPLGTMIRLSLQAAAFPAFAVNPGTGLRPEDAAAADASITMLCLRHGTAASSVLRLPVET